MTYKQETLIDKGYDKESVIRVSSFTDEELDNACEIAFKYLSNGVSSNISPKCIYIGGQPGVGKSVLSDKLKYNINAIELSMDACRMFHPRYLEIEKLINNYYKGKDITSEFNPGNDIASFTHDFSGAMINRLIDMSSSKKFNILLEWNMRHSSDVLECMSNLKTLGYKNEAIVVTCNKDISLEACKLRADVMNSYHHIVRRVSKSFHDLCINTIPKSVDEIYSVGIEKNILDNMKVVLRNGNIKWDSYVDKNMPSRVINDIYLDKAMSDINNKEYAKMSFKKESLGINKLIKLEDLRNDILEYREKNQKKVVNL